jgi:ribosomal-protein-alanine N-acetyltransferase
MTCLIDISAKNFRFFQNDILEIERSSFASPWSPDIFREETLGSISRIRVLMIDKKVGGYICFWVYAGEIHLMNIAVHPEKRGQGHGQYLLTQMIEEGISEGAASAWLEVRPSNSIARSLYQKVGFTEIARRPRYYTDTMEDAIMMSLPLPNKEAGRSMSLTHKSGLQAAF